MAQGVEPTEHPSHAGLSLDQKATRVAEAPAGPAASYTGWIIKWPTDSKRGSQKRRFLRLQGHTLSYYETEDDALRDQSDPKGSLVLTADSVVSKKEQPPSASMLKIAKVPSEQTARGNHVLVVKTPTKELCFRCEKDVEEGTWVQHVQEAIDALKARDKSHESRAASAAGASPVSSTSGPPTALSHNPADQMHAVPVEPVLPTTQDAGTAAAPLPTRTPPTATPAVNGSSSKTEEVVVAEGVSSVEAVGPRDASLTPQLSTDTGLGPGGGGSRSDTGTIVHVASSEAAVALNLDDERVSGWVKKSRRKYFLVLQGHTLEFFNTTAELYAGKPPRETVVLSPDCTVESRKLPTKLRATGATTTASMAATTATSSAGTSGAAATGTGGNGNTTNPGPDAGFSDLQEPDSVIDLHMSGQSTITLQCFSVEEENRWISHLQLAIGSLGGTFDPLKLGIGPDGKLRRPGEYSPPRSCCIVS